MEKKTGPNIFSLFENSFFFSNSHNILNYSDLYKKIRNFVNFMNNRRYISCCLYNSSNSKIIQRGEQKNNSNIIHVLFGNMSPCFKAPIFFYQYIALKKLYKWHQIQENSKCSTITTPIHSCSLAVSIKNTASLYVISVEE